MPIRILHVVTYMGRGGIETMLMNYYRKLDRDKVQFDFLVHREFEADYDQEIEALGGKIYRLPRLNPFRYSYLAQLDQFFAVHTEYNIVHSHLDCMAGIPLKYAKKHGVPCRIAHAHNNNQSKDAKYIMKLFFKRNIAKYANHLFACGKEAGEWMFGEKQFSILYNAIDAKEYAFDSEKRKKVRQGFHIQEETLVVGHVGRFFSQKNHSFIIEVFDEIQKKQPNSKLLLVGTGELMEDMQKKVEQLGISDKVIFAGVRKDVPHLLQAMDVFLFPSLFEGMPLVMIEAQASGLPCLISERVPMECEKTTGLVQQLPLGKGTLCWADEVLKLADIPRKNTMSEIVKSGFDIHENEKWLAEFYVDKYENE